MIREAFAADLYGAAAFAHRMDQCDAIGINDAEHRRRSQESLRPILRGREEAKEPRPLGEVGKQRAIDAGQPAIECPVAPPLRAWSSPKVTTSLGQRWALGMFGDGVQLLIDLVEQGRDKIEGDHVRLRAWQGVTLSTSVEEVYDHDNKTSKY